MSKERPGWARNLPEKDYDLAMRGVFTTVAAAAFTGHSVATIRKAIAAGDLKAKMQGKGWRIQKRDLDVFFGLEEA